MKDQKISPPSIKTLQDIHQVVKFYMPGQKTTAREMLEEGLAKLNRGRSKTEEEQQADFGGFVPADGPSEDMSSVDLLIKSNLGGVRKGNYIQWTIESGTYQFDPYGGTVRKVG